MPRDDPRLKQNTKLMLKVVLEGSGITTTFPLSAQAVRDDTPIGRMIAGQPGPQGNMCASKGRHKANQFTGHTIEMQHKRAAKSRPVCGQGPLLPQCGQRPRIHNSPGVF